MGILRWYKRDPRAALYGMMGLSLEARGVFITILDLIYIHDGSVIDDPKFICNWLNCNIRTWRRVRQTLLDAGKLYVHAGHLHNLRADEEAKFALNLIKLSSEKSLKRWSEYRKINGLVNAGGVTPTITTTNLLSFLDKKHSRKED